MSPTSPSYPTLYPSLDGMRSPTGDFTFRSGSPINFGSAPRGSPVPGSTIRRVRASDFGLHNSPSKAITLTPGKKRHLGLISEGSDNPSNSEKENEVFDEEDRPAKKMRPMSAEPSTGGMPKSASSSPIKGMASKLPRRLQRFGTPGRHGVLSQARLSMLATPKRRT